MTKTRAMDSELILGAGGIVWKNARKRKLLIVFRDRHNDGWSLPKGKKNPDESLQQAAVREVTEESALKVSPTCCAGVVRYNANGKSKTVVFWHMIAQGPAEKRRDDEVKDVKWVTLSEALNLITHEEQKELLRTILNCRQKDSLTERLSQISLPFRIWALGTRLKRLRGDAEAFGLELESFIESRNHQNAVWARKAKDLLQQALACADNAEVDNGWKALHAAKRQMLLGMDKDELLDHATIIRIEAEKLNEWRKKAVDALLVDRQKSDGSTEVRKELVYLAATIRDEHYNNGYYKNRLVHNTYATLLIILAIIISLLLYNIYNASHHLTDALNLTGDGKRVLSGANFFEVSLGIIFFGLFGATMSALLKARAATEYSRIPEILSSRFVMLSRVAVGAGLAYIILFFLESDFALELFDQKTRFSNIQTYFAIAFVSGFTERLVLKAVEMVAGK